MDNNLQKKIKNKFNDYLTFVSIKLLNLFGYKYNLQKVPKNHLSKYIEYQIYLQKEQEKKTIEKYNIKPNKYYLEHLKSNIVKNIIKKDI